MSGLTVQILSKIIRDAAAMHDDSWDEKEKYYKIDKSKAANIVCNKSGFPELEKLIWNLLVVAWNDALDWAEKHKD